MSAEWGYNADGTPRKFGDLSSTEQREVIKEAGKQLQAEADDPGSAFSRACKAIVRDHAKPRTRQ